MFQLKSSVLRTTRGIGTLAAAAVLGVGASLALAGNNPMPNTGSPHGTGITHAQYPNGYTLNGVFTPTFNSYLDNKDGTPNDERPFLVGRVGNGGAAHSLTVNPGDEITIRAFVHNDAGASGNLNGTGPSVAKNTRMLMAFPTGQTGPALNVSSYLYADNAVVDESNRDLKTISDNLEIKSASGQPIKLSYKAGSAQVLQSNAARGQSGYRASTLTSAQEHWLFAGTRVSRGGNWEIGAADGLGIGHDGQYTNAVGNTQAEKLDWFGCDEFHGYVLYKATVEAVPVDQPKKGELKIFKYVDANGNKTRDNDEQPQPGVTFDVSGPNDYQKSVVTGGNGEVMLTDLDAGTYTATEQVPSGYDNTTGLTQSGEVAADNDPATFAFLTFGNKPKEVCTDKNVLKIRTTKLVGGDAVLPKQNTSVTVTGPNGFNQTVVTDLNGEAALRDLMNGSYTVTEQTPAEFHTQPPQTVELKDCMEKSVSFLNKPKVNPETGSLVIFKFEDKNGNGTYESETPLANVTFTVNGPAQDTDKGPLVGTFTTNAEGRIVINDLQPGAYTVSETVPGGFRVTTAQTQNVSVVVNQSVEVKFGNQRVCIPPNGGTPTPDFKLCSPSPTPTSPLTPPTDKGELPKTGAAEAAALSLFGLAASAYLYLRERRALKQAQGSYRVK